MITRRDVDAARRLLSIVAPVEIRLTRYLDGTCGRVIGFRDGVWIVGLDTYLNPRDASITLWHELVHVHQMGKLGGIAQFGEMALREAREARVVGPRARLFFWKRAYRRMPHATGGGAPGPAGPSTLQACRQTLSSNQTSQLWQLTEGGRSQTDFSREPVAE